jgi:hypothetical protein
MTHGFDGVGFDGATVRESVRRAIFVVRVRDAILDFHEAEQVAGRMRDRLEARGEVLPEVVVVQGDSKETLRLFGSPRAVTLVRTAMFNAQIVWSPLTLD